MKTYRKHMKPHRKPMNTYRKPTKGTRPTARTDPRAGNRTDPRAVTGRVYTSWARAPAPQGYQVQGLETLF